MTFFRESEKVMNVFRPGRDWGGGVKYSEKVYTLFFKKVKIDDLFWESESLQGL